MITAMVKDKGRIGIARTKTLGQRLSDFFGLGGSKSHRPRHGKGGKHRGTPVDDGPESYRGRHRKNDYEGKHTPKAAQARTSAPTGAARGVARASTTERPGQRAKAVPGQARHEAASRPFAQGGSHAQRVRSMPPEIWWGSRK
jgi:hypothetical protein